MARLSAGWALVDAFARLGVTNYFCVPGESFLEVLDAAETDPRTHLISTRHESGASFMAEASAKLTGVPAVAMATRAVGAANLAIGVHTAFHDSTPLIALLGQVDQKARGRDGFQEIDLQSFYRPITKWTTCLTNAMHAGEVAYRAFVAATTGRPGPVLIELPADILAEVREMGLPSELRTPSVPVTGSPPALDAVKELYRRLLSADRPVAIVGGGAQPARREVEQLADRFGVGVYTAFRRQDAFRNDHGNYLGHLTLGTSPGVLEALEDADLVLVLGSRLGEVTSQGYRLPSTDAEIVHVDLEPRSMGVAARPVLAVAADVRLTLDAVLCQSTPEIDRRDWSEAHGRYLAESTIPDAPIEGPIQPTEVISTMQRTLPSDTVIASDAGNFSIFLHRYWKYTLARTQLAPTSGAMGYAVPAAVAAKLAAPQRTVVAVAGDGGFLMTGQELETAVRYGAPIVVLVLRNGLYGTIAMHQLKTFGRTAGTDIGAVDLAGYAASLGAVSFSVQHREDLEPAMEVAIRCGKTALLDISVDPEAITPTTSLSSLAPPG